MQFAYSLYFESILLQIYTRYNATSLIIKHVEYISPVNYLHGQISAVRIQLSLWNTAVI